MGLNKMATRDTLNALIQKVGLNKAVKLLNTKGIGRATYQKMANGEIPISKSVIGKASYANRLADQQIQFRQNKEAAKRLGFDKVLKRTGGKTPSLKSGLKELQDFNRVFSNRNLSLPSIFRLTGITQSQAARMIDKYSIDPSSISFVDRRIQAKTTDGDTMYLVYLQTPKYKQGKKVIERDWYWTAEENIDHYKKFKAGEADALYQIWTYQDVFLHEFATDAQPKRFIA